MGKSKNKPIPFEQFFTTARDVAGAWKQAAEATTPLVEELKRQRERQAVLQPTQEPVFDAYDALGVDQNCTEDEFKRRWKACAKAYHPDMGCKSDVMFKMINQAAEIVKKEKGWK